MIIALRSSDFATKLLQLLSVQFEVGYKERAKQTNDILLYYYIQNVYSLYF